MVTLPHNFTATRFPGYFWNVETQALYSIKSGVLTKLARTYPNRWNGGFNGYRISVNGVRRGLHINYLKRLDLGWSEIGVR